MLGIIKAKIAAQGLTGSAALNALTPEKIREQKGDAARAGKYTGKSA